MPKVRVRNNLLIHYERAGDGPDVVMIHGLTGNMAVWHLQIIPRLFDQFRMLTYDLRGHGYTEMTPSGYTADDMADDLFYLLEELEIGEADLIGHSYGADIALYFALRYPRRVRRVVAIEAALPALIHIRQRDEWQGWAYWAEYLERSGCPVPLERRSDAGYMLRQSLTVPKKWGPLNGLPRNPKPFLRLLDTTTMVQDYEVIGDLTLDRIPLIETPVTLIYDEGSAFLPTHDHLLGALPRAESLLLPKSHWGHFGPLEQPELLAEYLADILSRDASTGHVQQAMAST